MVDKMPIIYKLCKKFYKELKKKNTGGLTIIVYLYNLILEKLNEKLRQI